MYDGSVVMGVVHPEGDASVRKAAHIPGTENVQADFLSRGSSLPNEWMLHKEVFQKICCTARVQLEIDLFASARNVQLPKFCSRGRDPQVSMMDALSFPWTIQGLFAFPLFSMIPKVLEKVAREEVDLLLVAPFLAKEAFVFPCC